MHISVKTVFVVTALSLVTAPGYAGAKTKGPPASVVAQLKAYQASDATTEANLKTFDTLDFDVYSNQKWDRLKESHSPDILVHYPDGSTTKGLPAHIEALKPMFVFAPNTSIKVHPVRFGQGAWTGVIGVMEGDFTRPLPIGGGKTIPATGKHFVLQMATLGHWTKAGVMDEEYLFWDNASLMKQIGVG